MNSKILRRSAIAASIMAAAAGGYVVAMPGLPHGAVTATVPVAAAPGPAATAALPNFTSIVDMYGPAVVNISVTSKARPVANVPQFDENDPLFEFFRRFGPGVPRIPQGQQFQRGLGSGFIVSKNGVILTNAHVVDGAQEVTVKLTDRREFQAKVIGVDKQTDIAVLKIAAKDLPKVKLASHDDVRVGEWVLAIGSPFGFENSVTSGIVSAKSRALPNDTYVPFIQTDVAVNPGNSGGPLFNMNGEVVGINSQIYSQTGGYQGVSFAIPIDVAMKVSTQLEAHGKVTRGRLGVTIQEVNQALADSFGLQKPSGALVSSVEKGGPADKAGIQPGDVIVAVDGKAIAHSYDLPGLIGDEKPGSVAKLDVLRKGSNKTFSVTVGEMGQEKVAANDQLGEAGGRLGLAVRPLDRDEQAQAGVNGGLLVEDVAGPAARAGIQPGDVILSLNGTAVQSVEQLKGLAAKSGKHVALLVQREDAKIFVPIDLG